MALPKEQVVKAVERRFPDRVPSYFVPWISSETRAKYGNALQVITDEHPDDLTIVDLLSTIWGWPTDFTLCPEWVDAWGVGWRCLPDGAGMVAVASDLMSDWANLSHYVEEHIPDLERPGLFDAIDRVVANHPDTYVVTNCVLGPWERIRAARGTENMALDLYANGEQLISLGEVVVEYFRRLIAVMARHGVDAFMLSDDFGVQRSLLIRPEQWRKVFKPWFKQLYDEIHRQGMSVWQHSCGNITAIVPDLIEMGLDVLHPIQPGAMDQVAIAREYCGQITFFGGIDVQQTLPFGTPQDVEEHIRWLIDTFDRPEGGFLLAPANMVTPETPLANIDAALRAIDKYARGARI